MKSQFSKIAKIRKQKRDAIERELLKSQNKERMLNHKIAALYDEISAVQIPKEGMISLLLMVGEQKSILNRDKKRCEQELVSVQRNTKQLQSEYKKHILNMKSLSILKSKSFKR